MVSSHILDTVQGRPGVGVVVQLFSAEELLAEAVTDEQGRIKEFVDAPLRSGMYRLRFFVAEYFGKLEIATLYPYVDVTFSAEFPGHYHIPLILAPNGYTTYRGS